MSCEVAALPFQAHANYGTWSIDFKGILNTNAFLKRGQTIAKNYNNNISSTNKDLRLSKNCLIQKNSHCVFNISTKILLAFTLLNP